MYIPERYGADTLPEDIRQMVAEECRYRAAPKPVNIVIFLVFSVAFGYAGIQALAIARSADMGALMLLWAVPFLAVPFILANSIFIRPKRILGMAERGDYEYYIGTITDKYTTHHDDGSHHYFVIDNNIRFKCVSEQYRICGIGDRYILLYFHKKRPEVGIRLAPSGQWM